MYVFQLVYFSTDEFQENDGYMENINIQMQNTSISSASESGQPPKKGLKDPQLERNQPQLSQEESKTGAQLNVTRPKTWWQRCCPCFSLEFFSGYFDVTTQDIKERLLTSLIPFNRKFFTAYKAKPDLYGPFWIYTTLIIVLTIAGNFSRYMQTQDVDKFSYNFNYIPIATTVIYSIGVGLPLALKVLMKFLGADFFGGSSLMEVIGIYGYSFTSFLLTAFICAFPIDEL